MLKMFSSQIFSLPNYYIIVFIAETRHLGADNKGATKRTQNKKGAGKKGAEQKGRRAKRARDHDVASPLLTFKVVISSDNRVLSQSFFFVET